MQKSSLGEIYFYHIFIPGHRASRVCQACRCHGGASLANAVAGTRILIVEDNAENVILLNAYLDNLSLSLDFAVNGLGGGGKTAATRITI